MSLEGGCLCGAVRYRIHDDPLTLYACHCTDCQRQSGSAFGLSMIVARTDFEVVQGEPLALDLTTDDGRNRRPRLCGACGNRLYNESKVAEVVVVRGGTVDGAATLRPIGHIWTRSAQPWVRIPEDALTYPGQPEDMLELVRAWRGRPSDA
jgi:hypothetical protein